MVNEIVLLSTALIDLAFVTLAFRYAIPGLTALLTTNIILVSTFGSKVLTVFGFETNAGNIFYACAFFAGIMLAEHYGKKAAYKSVWVGFLALVLFVFVGQLTIRAGTTATEAGKALLTLFNAVPRIALGSAVAYLLSQNLNIYIYSLLGRKTSKKSLGARVAASSLAGQFVDSLVFFTIAFAGVLPTQRLVQFMVTGFLVKVSVGIISIVFLKLSFLIKPPEKINYQSRVA